MMSLLVLCLMLTAGCLATYDVTTKHKEVLPTIEIIQEGDRPLPDMKVSLLSLYDGNIFLNGTHLTLESSPPTSQITVNAANATISYNFDIDGSILLGINIHIRGSVAVFITNIEAVLKGARITIFPCMHVTELNGLAFNSFIEVQIPELPEELNSMVSEVANTAVGLIDYEAVATKLNQAILSVTNFFLKCDSA